MSKLLDLRCCVTRAEPDVSGGHDGSIFRTEE
jgi:hypothetical protein